MIENEQQFKFSKQQLARLCAAVERLRRKYPNEREFNVYSYGARIHIEQIEREMADYLAPQEPLTEREMADYLAPQEAVKVM